MNFLKNMKRPKITLIILTDSVGAIQYNNGRLITSCSHKNNKQNKIGLWIKELITNKTIISKHHIFNSFFHREMNKNTFNYIVSSYEDMKKYSKFDKPESPCSYKYVTSLEQAILSSAKENPNRDIYIICDKTTFQECECIADEITHFESYKVMNNKDTEILKLDYEKWIIYKTKENEASATNYLKKI